MYQIDSTELELLHVAVSIIMVQASCTMGLWGVWVLYPKAGITVFLSGTIPIHPRNP